MGRSTTVGGVQVSSEVLSQREALLVRHPCPHQAMQCKQASFVIRHIIVLTTTQPPRPSLWWLVVLAGLVSLVVWLDRWRLRSVTKTSSSMKIYIGYRIYYILYRINKIGILYTYIYVGCLWNIFLKGARQFQRSCWSLFLRPAQCDLLVESCSGNFFVIFNVLNVFDILNNLNIFNIFNSFNIFYLLCFCDQLNVNILSMTVSKS